MCMQKEAYSYWNLKGVFINDTEPVVLIMPVETEHCLILNKSKGNKTPLFNSPFLLCPTKDDSSAVSGGPSCSLAAWTWGGPGSA